MPKGKTKKRKVAYHKHQTQQPPKIVLLGDSTIDNGYWVEEGQAVTSQISERLPAMRIVNLAVDGFTTTSMLEGDWMDGAVSSPDHPHKFIKPLKLLNKQNNVDYIVLSVLGNDFRAELAPLVFMPADQRAAFIDQTMVSIVFNYLELVKKIRYSQPLANLIILTQYTPDLTNDLYKIYFLMYLINTKKDIKNYASAFCVWGCYKLFYASTKSNLEYVQTLHSMMAKLYQAIFKGLDKESVAVIDLSTSFDYRDSALYKAQIEPSAKGAQLISGLIEYVVKHHNFSKPGRLYAQPPGEDAEIASVSLVEAKNNWYPGLVLNVNEGNKTPPGTPAFFKSNDQPAKSSPAVVQGKKSISSGTAS